jgi:hypothetical protein
MTQAVDRCPLCGQPNRCAQVTPEGADQPCWCFSVQIDRAALERLPTEARGVACLCPNCARLAAGNAPQVPIE